MTLSDQIAWDDTVLPFQLDRPDTRGRLARLDGVLDNVLAQHSYPPAIEALVAEMALLTALIGQTMKLRWKLSLQVRGDGPARLIATDYFAPASAGEAAQIRAYSGFDRGRMRAAAPFELIGKGYFAILIDQGAGTTPYQGITPIAGGSLAACAETYFAQSEQIPTRIVLAGGRSILRGEGERWRAGAVMLQQMPKASPHVAVEGGSGDGGLLNAADILGEKEGAAWTRVNRALDRVDDLDLIGPRVQATDLLLRLFADEAPRVFTPQPVRFGCTCSADRVRQAMSIYSPKDIGHMTTDEGTVTADCQFCGAHYELDPGTLGFAATDGPDDDDADD